MRDRQSKLALKYISWLCKKRGIEYKFAGNGREERISANIQDSPNYRVDAIFGQHIIEIQGCLWVSTHSVFFVSQFHATSRFSTVVPFVYQTAKCVCLDRNSQLKRPSIGHAKKLTLSRRAATKWNRYMIIRKLFYFECLT